MCSNQMKEESHIKVINYFDGSKVILVWLLYYGTHLKNEGSLDVERNLYSLLQK